jgi:hypothetical protein
VQIPAEAAIIKVDDASKFAIDQQIRQAQISVDQAKTRCC